MSNTNATGTIDHASFGTLPSGANVEIYTLRNAHGLEARIMTYGGVLVSLKTPDRHGQLADVVLGHDDLGSYLKHPAYFGALIGRYGNRLAHGTFTLNGKKYQLAKNNGPNHLHGGLKGFDKVVWLAKPVLTADGPSLELTYLSKDGEEGYPGNLNVTAIYTLTSDDALRLDFRATTDAPTICNLTHHSYFNLDLSGNGSITNHQLMIDADQFTPVDKHLIPSGELESVANTPFDFRTATAIGARIHQSDKQLKYAGGYDHNWVINKPANTLGLCARVTDPNTGRILETYSTEPGLQFYSGNFLDGSFSGKNGITYRHRQAFCLEPQHFPDSPNHPEFPTATLLPGQVYTNTIIYKFSAK